MVGIYTPEMRENQKAITCQHLDHGKGYYTLYAHLAGFAVNLGDTVLAGRKIGSVGETGSLKGPILHFEIREFAKPQNPRSWLGVKR